MPQLEYWLRIKENPMLLDEYTSAVLPLHNDGGIVHYAAKLESDMFVSFLMPDGRRHKVMFDITDAIGKDIFFVYNFDDKRVTKIYVNAKSVEFRRV